MEATLYVPDIMLLDLGLPDIDGVDIIKKSPDVVDVTHYRH